MNVFIFHGTKSTPKNNWFPYLERELKSLGIDVVVPQFSTPDGQNETNWLKTFEPYQKQVNDQTVFIGHSMGATLALRLLEKRTTPILASILAAPSMAEIVLNAAAPETKIDVLDICATPLLTCQRVFQPEQIARMKFTQADALTFTDGPYDLIVTDAFLTRFNDEQRLQVLKNWARMLKPDGRVLTTWRIGDKQGEKGYGDKEDKRVGYSDEKFFRNDDNFRIG